MGGIKPCDIYVPCVYLHINVVYVYVNVRVITQQSIKLNTHHQWSACSYITALALFHLNLKGRIFVYLKMLMVFSNPVSISKLNVKNVMGVQKMITRTYLQSREIILTSERFYAPKSKWDCWTDNK